MTDVKEFIEKEREKLFEWVGVELEEELENKAEDADTDRFKLFWFVEGIEDVEASSSKRIALLWYLNLERGDDEHGESLES